MEFDKIDQPIERIVKGPGGKSIIELQMEHITGSKSVSTSADPLPLFRELHRFLEGAATKRYVKSLDTIPETAAINPGYTCLPSKSITSALLGGEIYSLIRMILPLSNRIEPLITPLEIV